MFSPKAYTVGVTVDEVLKTLVKVLFSVRAKDAKVVVGLVVWVAFWYNVVRFSRVENAVAVLSKVATRSISVTSPRCSEAFHRMSKHMATHHPCTPCHIESLCS